MGMGYGANYADVMEDKEVKTLCKITYDKLMEAIEADEETGDLEDLARDIAWGNIDEDSDVYLAYRSLQLAFENATGLEVYLEWHDHDDCGDRYDDVNGYFWSVDGVYQLTPAGEKFKDKIARKFYVTFG
jgi:hypothetical protein